MDPVEYREIAKNRQHYEIRKTYITYQDVSILRRILRIMKYESYGTGYQEI